jgi:hypothetical protein
MIPSESLVSVTLQPSLIAMENLQELRGIWTTYSTALLEVEEITRAYTEISNQEQDLTRELAQFGPCPTCGALACIH